MLPVPIFSESAQVLGVKKRGKERILTLTSRRLTALPIASVSQGRSGRHLLSPSTTNLYR